MNATFMYRVSVFTDHELAPPPSIVCRQSYNRRNSTKEQREVLIHKEEMKRRQSENTDGATPT